MNINTDTIIPISLANQNFSKVARLVDQYGSAVIMKNIRENDFACRWGGEEILILIEGSIGSTDTIARRIWEDIGHAEVEHDGMKIKVTMTFGVAEAAMNLRLEDLIQQADNRLYYGKGHGKNQVVVSMPNGF